MVIGIAAVVLAIYGILAVYIFTSIKKIFTGSGPVIGLIATIFILGTLTCILIEVFK